MYSIYKIDFDKQEHQILYDCIEDINKAELLGQLAMSRKDFNELIFITAGSNKSINKNYPELYKEALSLEEEYKYIRKSN